MKLATIFIFSILAFLSMAMPAPQSVTYTPPGQVHCGNITFTDNTVQDIYRPKDSGCRSNNKRIHKIEVFEPECACFTFSDTACQEGTGKGVHFGPSSTTFKPEDRPALTWRCTKY
ncbi:hypothetical protein P154DRAFT_580440 [Amniculicola lignicola CBS 123094]|uniref:Uncharacterized protein n=1 Tax=Amniculicola lignicola CBS 123094 TaxID=1392246 RepID=A0A6A5W4V3_9PLEO|nr:hypothetical protein P154DRAFT_580440 [Amniculicola lignicola CBS 123094]